MEKFEGWRTEELQYVASLMAERDMERRWEGNSPNTRDLYEEIIREIRNRRVAEELS